VFSTITMNTSPFHLNWLFAHMKINPSEHLTEQMSLKDTTIYDKLKVDNWEGWEQNTRHLHEYTEINYGLAIDCAQQYCRLCQQEVLNFAAPSLPLSTSSAKDSVSTSEGEKAAAAPVRPMI